MGDLRFRERRLQQGLVRLGGDQSLRSLRRQNQGHGRVAGQPVDEGQHGFARLFKAGRLYVRRIHRGGRVQHDDDRTRSDDFRLQRGASQCRHQRGENQQLKK